MLKGQKTLETWTLKFGTLVKAPLNPHENIHNSRLNGKATLKGHKAKEE